MAVMIVVGGALNPATATPAEPTVAKSADEIVGTWVTSSCDVPGGCYTRFDKDGTFRQSAQLDSQPFAVNSYEFKGTEMVIKQVSVAPGIPSCPDQIGRYQVHLLEGGYIQIVVIDDQCPPRAAAVGVVYKPAR